MDRTQRGHKERLRSRYRKDGLTGFHDYEVLELILSFSLIRKDTKGLAKELIDKFGKLTDVINAPFESLMEVDGVGERTASLLKLVKDAGEYHLKENLHGKKVINSPQAVHDYLIYRFKGLSSEEFFVIYLSSAHQVVYSESLFSGTIDRSAVYVRELIERVIRFKSSAVILAHNHPSGNLKPSVEDRRITDKIKRALKYIDVKLVDHLVIGDNDYFSFRENNLL